MSIPHINTIISKVLSAAEAARTEADYNGRRNDGGAAMLEAQVRFYRAGMDGTLPKEWQKFAKEAENEADPEYREYLRLRKKFE